MTIRNLRVTKRLVAAVATAALGATVLAIPTSPVSATSTVTSTVRLSGPTRYETSNKVANTPAITNQTKFVLASGSDCADGLSAAPLAGALNASLLLTPPDLLPNSVLGTLTSMSSTVALNTPKYVVIVGGAAAVSVGIQEQLTSLGYTVSRKSGIDRYATANAAAAATFTETGAAIGLFGGYRTAFLASGVVFADSLSASGWAFHNKHPMFLTDGTTLTAETAAAITAAGVQQIIILGGEAAISAGVESSAAGVTGVIATTRIGGADRYETATLFAAAIGAEDANFLKKVVLVDGTNCPDALVASQYASAGEAAILPVTDPLPTIISSFLDANKATIADVETIGGTNAVAASVVAAADGSATIPQPTAMIEALDGSLTAKVTFTAPLSTATATTVTSYQRVTGAGAISNPAAVAYSYSATTGSVAVLTFNTVLASGDTVRVIGNVIAHASITGLTVAAASTVVAVDGTAASATVVAYPGAAASLKRVWVTLSANTDAATFLCSDLVHSPATLTGTPATFTNKTQVGASQTYTCDVPTVGIAVGEVVTLAKDSIDSSASTPVKNDAVVATVTADATAPSLQSATYSTSATGGAQAAVTTTPGASLGKISVTARAATVVAGNAGNDWSLKFTQAVGATAVTVNSTTKLVTITLNLVGAPQAIAVTDALNANADFSALFIASVVVSNAMTNTVTAAAPLIGGKDLMTVVATFSEPLGAALAAGFGTDVAGAGGGFTLTANAGTDDGRLTGVLTVTSQITGKPLSGVSTLSTAVTTKDRSGLAAAAGASLTVTMTPTSI